MSSVNKAILVGRVGNDPDVRYSQKGEPIVSFSLATSEKYLDKETTQWHKVTIFGKTAEIAKEYVTKGKLLYIEGQISYEDWTDKEGNKRNSTKILVGFGGKMQLLGPKDSGAKSTAKKAPTGSESGSGAEIPADDEIPF